MAATAPPSQVTVAPSDVYVSFGVNVAPDDSQPPNQYQIGEFATFPFIALSFNS